MPSSEFSQLFLCEFCDEDPSAVIFHSRAGA